MTENYCNNCGKMGHTFSQCKYPITSFGTIVFRIHPDFKEIQYLMIRRKHTLGYIDFMRGKYSLFDKCYIMNMLKQMTIQEKNKLLLGDFDTLWQEIWGENSYLYQYKNEENSSKEKFQSLVSGKYNSFFSTNNKKNFYTPMNGGGGNLNWTLFSLINETNIENQLWVEAEWGFPKGRKQFQEKEYNCALREMSEETGYSAECVVYVKNIFPFEENFTGSNYKSYKHKYFLMFMNFEEKAKEYDKTEIDVVEWKTFKECVSCIRPYNLEKIKMISNVNDVLLKCV